MINFNWINLLLLTTIIFIMNNFLALVNVPNFALIIINTAMFLYSEQLGLPILNVKKEPKND